MEPNSTSPAMSNNQVMDVVPPPVAVPLASDMLPDDLAIPPADESNAKVTNKVDKSASVPKPVTPKQSSNGTTTAIIATVIIVLGLAALAVTAYIKTK